MLNSIKKIEKLRSTAQKGIHQDELFCFFFLRPFSFYISYFLYKYTKISANAITYMMFLLSFTLPVAISNIQGEKFFYYLSGFYFFVIFLDQIDGELARLRQIFSKQGYFFDLSLWFTLSIWSILLFYRLEEANYISNLLFWFLISIEFVFLYLSVFDYLRSGVAEKLFNTDKKINDDMENSFNLNLFVRFIRILPQKNFLFLLIPIYFLTDITSSGILQIHIFIVLIAYSFGCIAKLNSLKKSFND